MDKGLLKRALEDTEDPTPGYMFRDIAQWTFIDHNTQTKLIAFLMDKLKPSGSVHVLAKTLRVIKVLCETGHADFQREMQRRNEELKQYAAYRGKPDAKYGDKLNEKVRTSAREAIDSAFSHRKETKVQVSQGHGSDSTYEEKGTTFTTGVRVTETNGWTNSSNTATSNAHMAPMPTTNKWAEHMAQAASGKGGAPGAAPGVVSSFVDAAKTGFGLWHENIKTTEQLVMESMTTNSDFRPVEVHGFGHTPSAGGAAGGWKFAEEGTAGGSTVRQETTKILTPFQAEVERVCNFKNTPQRVELTQFVAGIEGIMERRGSSDLEELAEVLDEHLQQKQSWQHRLNAMAAIEALLRHPDLEGKDTLEQYFKENPEDVQRNVHVVQSSLKEKAQKVLKLLGVPERMKGQVETSHAPAQQISVATGNGGISWNAAPAPTAEPTNDTAGGSDIMGGMVVKSRAKQAPEDKNKLRKRAAMKVEDDEEPPVVEQRQQTRPPATQQQSARPTQQPAQDNGWGSWGDNGSTANTWEFDAPAQAQQQSAPPPAPSSNKGKDALDDFFGGPSNAWGGSLPASQPPVPQPVPVAQPVPVVQQPTVAAQQPPNGINMQMVMQMQQQLQMMLTQINMSDPNAVAQMQALMAQQQQLMAMVTAGAAPAAPAPEVNTPSSPVAPHSTFSLPTPAPRQAQNGGDAFASVQQEMMSKLMRPQQ